MSATRGTVVAKRKAEDLGSSIQSKAARLDLNGALAPPPSRSTTASPAQKGLLPKQAAYRGTVRPVAQESSLAAASGTGSASAAPTKSKTGYLALLEKAKAAQEAAKQVGGIKHKTVEKLSRREREKLQAEAASKNRSASAKGNTAAAGGKIRALDSSPANKAVIPLRKERKAIDVGYSGTMRPTTSREPSYRGTMQGAGATSRKAADNRRVPASRPGAGSLTRHERYSDEDEEDEDEEEDMNSASSDMEAGMDDLDEEEQASARIARMEDEAALREENEMKRQKLERKRKLEQLAAAAASKKKRY